MLAISSLSADKPSDTDYAYDMNNKTDLYGKLNSWLFVSLPTPFEYAINCLMMTWSHIYVSNYSTNTDKNEMSINNGEWKATYK